MTAPHEAHADLARDFLRRAAVYLDAGDLHQASEKGWGAAAHMVKAVALAQGWEYERHAHFRRVIHRIRSMTGDDRVRALGDKAEMLHGGYYGLGDDLDADIISEDLADVGELLDLLEPMAEGGTV